MFSTFLSVLLFNKLKSFLSLNIEKDEVSDLASKIGKLPKLYSSGETNCLFYLKYIRKLLWILYPVSDHYFELLLKFANN